MSVRMLKPHRDQVVLAVMGSVAYCVYARSWLDPIRLIYDIPASLTTFAFIAQLVLAFPKQTASLSWWYRIGVLSVMTAVTTGREFFAWPISGHLTCVTAVALVQSTDSRLPPWERLLYWTPVPIVLYMRCRIFDRNDHWDTYNAVLVAAVLAAPAILALYWNRDKAQPDLT